MPSMNPLAPLDMSPNAVAKTPRLDQATVEALPFVSQSEANGSAIVCTEDFCYRKASLAVVHGTPFWVNNQAVPRHIQRCVFHGQDVLSPFTKVRVWPEDAPATVEASSLPSILRDKPE